MKIEIPVENPEHVLKMLFGQDWDLLNGNLKFGVAKNLRIEEGRLVADAEITDMELFQNYGSKARLGGFVVKVQK